jgi:hypothetical protein
LRARDRRGLPPVEKRRNPVRGDTVNIHALALALLVALATPTRAAAERGPSTSAERARAVETTRRLERDPLGPGASKDRRWLLQWIVDIPDIEVRGCSGPLDVLKEDEERPYGKVLFAQSMFGIVAFLIEHPRERNDWVKVQLAGVESVLKAYRSLLDSEPGARWRELDLLLEARRQGKLRDIVEETMESCGEERGPGPGDPI